MPPAAASEQDCAICAAAFTAKARKPITCSSCDARACVECYKTYILGKNGQAECMFCHAAWSREYVDSVMPKAFRDNALKRKREDALLSLEKSLLPDTQVYVQMIQHKRELEAVQVARVAEAEHLMRQARAIQAQMARLDQHDRTVLDEPPGGGGVTRVAQQTPEETRKFIKSCPKDGCKGFLSTQYKCGLCETRVCPRCHLVLPPGVKGCRRDGGQAAAGAEADAGTAEAGAEAAEAEAQTDAAAPRGPPHVCNPDDVATVQLLLRDTKACPKCATPIYKVSGCDQMWCTQCHVAFSWRTGKMETGRVHNPHWYEWQRQNSRNGEIPREPGDAPPGAAAAGAAGGCGGDNARYLPAAHRLTGAKAFKDHIKVHQCIEHIRNVTMNDYPQYPRRMEDNRDLRIRYLMDEVDEDKWKKLLQQREKSREKQLAIRMALEVMVSGSTDIMWALVTDSRAKGAATLEQLERLRAYVNNCLTDISKRFSCKELRISPEWQINDRHHLNYRHRLYHY